MEVPMMAYNPVAPLAGYGARPQSANAHIARVKAAMLRSAQETLDGEGFTQLMPQLLTTLSGACGDPGTLIPALCGVPPDGYWPIALPGYRR